MAIEFPVIDPVAFSIGPLSIRWYAIAYLLGFILGWKYIVSIVKRCEYNTGARPIKETHIDDFLPWAIVGIILGGRIGYVLFYQFSFYIENPADILQVWKGGMSFHGGAAGAILAMLFYTRLKNLPFLQFTDLFSFAVPIGLFFGRIANFVNAELYGRITNASWGIIFPNAGPFPRHPSQLYEAILEGLVLFAVLYLLSRKPWIKDYPGIVSGVFLCGYGTFRFIIEFYREPDQNLGYFFDMFTMGQMLCIPMAMGGVYLIIRSKQKGAVEDKPQTPETQS